MKIENLKFGDLIKIKKCSFIFDKVITSGSETIYAIFLNNISLNSLKLKNFQAFKMYFYYNKKIRFIYYTSDYKKNLANKLEKMN